MTREHKLALIFGFAAVVIVGVFLSDHFSRARSSRVTPDVVNVPGTGIGLPGDRGVILPPEGETSIVKTRLVGPGEDEFPPEPLPAPFTPNGGGASGGQGQRERAVAGTPGWTGPEQSPDQWIDDPTAPGRDGVRGKPVSTGVERQHTVASGDNFYKLAQAYYKDASLHTALAQYNRGVSATSMKVGMVVKIPPKDVLQGKAVLGPVVPPTPPAPMARRDGATPARPDAKPETKPEARNPGRTYVVQPGDTFGKIAKALLGDERRRQEIADLNPDANPTNLRVGMTLKLPSK